jgi:hypothetical protein
MEAQMGPAKEFNHTVQAEQFKLELNQNLPHAGITCQFKLELNQNPGTSLLGIVLTQKHKKNTNKTQKNTKPQKHKNTKTQCHPNTITQ